MSEITQDQYMAALQEICEEEPNAMGLLHIPGVYEAIVADPAWHNDIIRRAETAASKAAG